MTSISLGILILVGVWYIYHTEKRIDTLERKLKRLDHNVEYLMVHKH